MKTIVSDYKWYRLIGYSRRYGLTTSVSEWFYGLFTDENISMD